MLTSVAAGTALIAASMAAGQSLRQMLMPDLGGAIGWLNSAPLSDKSLRGKVVLIDFWTYTCINSIRPLPYVKSWAAKYKDAGLVVIGVHICPDWAHTSLRKGGIEIRPGKPGGWGNA